MNLYWLQSGGCSGDSMSLLNTQDNLYSILEDLDVELLWHPSLSIISPKEHTDLIEDILNDKKELDILCIEGNVVQGPDGTGLFDTFHGKPKKDLIDKLVKKANYIIAVGTCASFGGIGSHEDEMDGIGLQFHHENSGGFLGDSFKTKSGLPIINLPGCPIQPQSLITVLEKIVFDMPIEFAQHNTLKDTYSLTVHQGCTRNEYHEYKVEESEFGERGCMFFHLGCHGTTTHAACNKYLWNEASSKTRAGVPCFGCTKPSFPHDNSFFKTENIIGTPIDLPDGVDRAHYLAYKDMAAAAAPKRLKDRTQKV